MILKLVADKFRIPVIFNTRTYRWDTIRGVAVAYNADVYLLDDYGCIKEKLVI